MKNMIHSQWYIRLRTLQCITSLAIWPNVLSSGTWIEWKFHDKVTPLYECITLRCYHCALLCIGQCCILTFSKNKKKKYRIGKCFSSWRQRCILTNAKLINELEGLIKINFCHFLFYINFRFGSKFWFLYAWHLHNTNLVLFVMILITNNN